MSLIGYVKAFFGFLWKIKLKLLLSIASALVFAFVIFPFDDLADWVSAQISIATRNSVFVQFEKLKMTLLPAGAQMDKVFVETAALPGLQIDQVNLSPSISALISQKIQGHVSAKGILKGDLDVRLTDGGKSERGADLSHLEVQAQKINLQDLRQLANLPVMLKGRLDVETNGKLDLAFQEQPEMDLNVKISQFELPAANLPLADMGDISLPEMKLSNVELKGKLNGGRFLIENGQIGRPGDDLQGTIKGTMAMNLRGGPAGVYPEFGTYNLEIDLLPSTSFKSRAGFFMSLLSGYQSGERIKLRLSGLNFYGPPKMAPLR